MDKPSVWNIRTWYSDSAFDEHDDGERSKRELKPTKKLREALAQGADPNEHGALLKAAQEGSTTQFKALLKAGADTERRTNDGQTALHIAVGNGDQDKFDALLKAGADINARIPETINIIDVFGEPVVNTPDEPGQTPAMIAARMGQTQMLETLTEKGASMEGVLHAAFVGDIELMERRDYSQFSRYGDEDREFLSPKLIEQGMDVEERTDVAFKFQRYPVSRITTFEGEQSTPLHLAAVYGRADSVKMLLDNGADIEAVDGNGYTALLLSREPKVFEVLIEAGANLHARDDVGNSVLHNHWSEDAARMLIDAGADVLAKNQWGELPGDRQEGFNHYPAHQVIRAAQKRAQLGAVSKQSRGQDNDLATPEQALAARQEKYGRAM